MTIITTIISVSILIAVMISSTSSSNTPIRFSVHPTNQTMILFTDQTAETIWNVSSPSDIGNGTFNVTVLPSGFNITIVPWMGSIATGQTEIRVLVTLGQTSCITPTGTVKNCIGNGYFTLYPKWKT